MYNAYVTMIQIKDVPETVAEEYKRRAALAGQSLQKYMRDKLIRDATRQPMAEILASARRRLAESGSAVTHADVIDAIEQARREARGDGADL